MAGYVDGFSDKKQAGDGARFHGSGVEANGVDAACCDFRFIETFCAGGVKGPVMQTVPGNLEGSVRPALWSSDIGEVGGEALRQYRLECTTKNKHIAAGCMLEQRTEEARCLW